MLNPSDLDEHLVSVNAAPIVSDAGVPRGILATFDDMTEIEKRNTSMQELLHKLKQSRAEIHRQNQELKLLATRDPPTLCLNRRAFFTELNPLYEQSARTGTPTTSARRSPQSATAESTRSAPRAPTRLASPALALAS